MKKKRKRQGRQGAPSPVRSAQDIARHCRRYNGCRYEGHDEQVWQAMRS